LDVGIKLRIYLGYFRRPLGPYSNVLRLLPVLPSLEYQSHVYVIGI